jgi:hypothetical protein
MVKSCYILGLGLQMKIMAVIHLNIVHNFKSIMGLLLINYENKYSFVIQNFKFGILVLHML